MADGFSVAEEARLVPTGREIAADKPPITIGLVNNMPDAALAATEAQFRRLIADAGGEREVRLKLFSLPGAPRSDAARAAVATRYVSINALPATPLDALIVTGAEPIAADLRDEPFWRDMTALIDWAEANTVSTLFSCLAAHAAVLHLDGVARTPLPTKCSGVFAMQAAAHPLTADQTRPLTPHSRWNGLDEAELVKRGYVILTRSDEIGVDAFARDRGSLFLFLQGHPEYDADTLMLEYRRDVRRFLLGARAAHPTIPAGYFDPEIERALADLAAETARRPELAALSNYAKILKDARPCARWRPTTERLYRNWLALVADRKMAR